jgi:hypothetical protein
MGAPLRIPPSLSPTKPKIEGGDVLHKFSRNFQSLVLKVLFRNNTHFWTTHPKGKIFPGNFQVP